MPDSLLPRIFLHLSTWFITMTHSSNKKMQRGKRRRGKAMARLHTKRNSHGREQESFLKFARGAVFYVSRGCLSRVRGDGNHRETQDRRLDLRLHRASAYYHTKSRQNCLLHSREPDFCSLLWTTSCRQFLFFHAKISGCQWLQYHVDL